MVKSVRFIVSERHLDMGDLKTWSVDGEESWFFKKDQAFIGAMGDFGVHKADLLRLYTWRRVC